MTHGYKMAIPLLTWSFVLLRMLTFSLHLSLFAPLSSSISLTA